MQKGIALNLGLNSVDPAQYEGRLATLKGCEFDAGDMHDIAVSQGFEARLMLGAEVTSANVINAIGSAAAGLAGGDIFLLTYSGHGSTLPDPINGKEPDSQNETLVLYDRNLIDDELFSLWKRFEAGVRIFFVCDSCHSGTAAEVFALTDAEPAAEERGRDEGFFSDNKTELDEDGEPRLIRAPTQVQQARHLGAFGAGYDAVRYLLTNKDDVPVRASVIQFGACQDKQKSFDGARNGLFTAKLREVWADGGAQGTYKQFFDRIRARVLPHNQDPNFFTTGVPNPAFEAQHPFTI